MLSNKRAISLLLFVAACLLGNIASVTRAAQQTPPRISRQHYPGFPGSAVEMLQRSDANNDINRQVRSSNNAWEEQQIWNQNNRNNINYYRRSRVNAEFATAAPAPSPALSVYTVEAEAEDGLVPVSVATTAAKTMQRDDNHNHGAESEAVDGGAQVVDKRKLLLSNLHLFNGTDTKNLTDSQKMLLIQIADRVARYGENNLFRELANAQQQHKTESVAEDGEEQEQEEETVAVEEGRANTKSDSPKRKSKAKPSKRPHAAVHSAAPSSLASTASSSAPSKASSSSSSTTTTKRQPLPGGAETTVPVASPTKSSSSPSSSKPKIRPNTSFTPSPAASSASSPVTPSVASTQSLSTPADQQAEKKSTTVATSRHTKKPPGGSVEDIIYDYNVTASALIESLSKPSPTSNSLLYQQTMHPAAAAAGSTKTAGTVDAKVGG